MERRREILTVVDGQHLNGEEGEGRRREEKISKQKKERKRKPQEKKKKPQEKKRDSDVR